MNSIKQFIKEILLFNFFLKIFFPRLRDYGRPWYRKIIYDTFNEARLMNLSKITFIEFGVANGLGIDCIKKITNHIKNNYNFEFNIIGFDSGGLPSLIDYRDNPSKWKSGFYKANDIEFKKNTKNTKIYIGDVKDTLNDFEKELKNMPLIGGIIFDVNLYSSTIKCFEIFNFSEKYTLPRIHCYFDDCNTIESIGERLAIKEYNEKNTRKKIEQNPLVKTLDKVNGWAMYEFHNFEHPEYSKHKKNPVLEANIKNE